MTPSASRLMWRVRIRMAECGLRSTRALQRRLRQEGVVISEAQLGRVINRVPASISTRLLEALCDVLACAPGDLLIIPGRASCVSPTRPHRETAPATVPGGESLPDPGDIDDQDFDPDLGPALFAIPKPARPT